MPLAGGSANVQSGYQQPCFGKWLNRYPKNSYHFDYGPKGKNLRRKMAAAPLEPVGLSEPD
jgi:hypothetical protein